MGGCDPRASSAAEPHAAVAPAIELRGSRLSPAAARLARLGRLVAVSSALVLAVHGAHLPGPLRLVLIAACALGAAATLGAAAAGLARPARRAAWIEFGRDHVRLPRLPSAKPLRVAYADLVGVHRVRALGRERAVVGVVGQVPVSYPMRAFATPEGYARLAACVRAGVASLPDAERRLRALDARDAAARAAQIGPPWVSITSATLLGVFFVAELALGALGSPERLLALGALVPKPAPAELYRLVTGNLLHLNTAHLALNAFALLGLGFACERLLGAPRFWLALACGALGGAAASVWLPPHGPSVGASTGVHGVAGALAYLFAARRDELPAHHRLPASFLGALLLLTLLYELTPGITGPARLDHASHAGGFAAGLLVTALSTRGVPLAELHRRSSLALRAAAAGVGALFAGGLALGAASAWRALGH